MPSSLSDEDKLSPSKWPLTSKPLKVMGLKELLEVEIVLLSE